MLIETSNSFSKNFANTDNLSMPFQKMSKYKEKKVNMVLPSLHITSGLDIIVWLSQNDAWSLLRCLKIEKKASFGWSQC